MSQNDLVLSHSAEAGMNWSKYSQFCALAKIMSLSVRIIDNAFPLRTSPCQDLRISSRPTKLKNEVIRVSFSSSFFSPYTFSFSFFLFLFLVFSCTPIYFPHIPILRLIFLPLFHLLPRHSSPADIQWVKT